MTRKFVYEGFMISIGAIGVLLTGGGLLLAYLTFNRPQQSDNVQSPPKENSVQSTTVVPVSKDLTQEDADMNNDLNSDRIIIQNFYSSLLQEDFPDLENFVDFPVWMEDGVYDYNGFKKITVDRLKTIHRRDPKFSLQVNLINNTPFREFNVGISHLQNAFSFAKKKDPNYNSDYVVLEIFINNDDDRLIIFNQSSKKIVAIVENYTV